MCAFMMPEEEVKQAEQEKKPQRVFGEEDLEPKKAKSAQKKQTKPAADKPRAKKVDKAIGRDMEEDSEFVEKKKPAPKKKSLFKKRKKKKTASSKKNGAGETFMRLGKGIKAGSVTVGQYSKKVMGLFDAYATGDGSKDAAGLSAFLTDCWKSLVWRANSVSPPSLSPRWSFLC